MNLYSKHSHLKKAFVLEMKKNLMWKMFGEIYYQKDKQKNSLILYMYIYLHIFKDFLHRYIINIFNDFQLYHILIFSEPRGKIGTKNNWVDGIHTLFSWIINA